MAQMNWWMGEDNLFFSLFPKPVDLVLNASSRFGLDWQITTDQDESLAITVHDADNVYLGMVAYVIHNGIPNTLLVIDAEGKVALTTWVQRSLV